MVKLHLRAFFSNVKPHVCLIPWSVLCAAQGKNFRLTSYNSHYNENDDFDAVDNGIGSTVDVDLFLAFPR